MKCRNKMQRINSVTVSQCLYILNQKFKTFFFLLQKPTHISQMPRAAYETKRLCMNTTMNTTAYYKPCLRASSCFQWLDMQRVQMLKCSVRKKEKISLAMWWTLILLGWFIVKHLVGAGRLITVPRRSCVLQANLSKVSGRLPVSSMDVLESTQKECFQ